MKAGDTVRHIPTGEEWVVAATQGTELICCCWPETMAPFSECELVKTCSDAEHKEQLLHTYAYCNGQLRGAWARSELESMGLIGPAKQTASVDAKFRRLLKAAKDYHTLAAGPYDPDRVVQFIAFQDELGRAIKEAE